MRLHSAFIFCLALLPLWASGTAQAKEIETNEFSIHDAPAWLTQTRVEKVTARILNRLEWSIRKTHVYWHASDAEYEKAQSLGPQALAVTSSRGDVATVHLGPKVNEKNFDQVFGHETVHVIVTQKYKSSIPKWLEEGLANYYAKHGTVDYKAIARREFPNDVRELAHPFKGSPALISYRYEASQALAEMLDKKCDLDNLIRISVQRDMETYIANTCEIRDLNAAFREWVSKKSK